ncbi:hypothetical protein [Arthrobacter sp. 9V]|uniref:hypothetical protein n=1 Tax=Micrococcaceae TaxID=1268 RepID=UPI0013590D77|nr:hypothetical protein [Arthrobacter sp. 9V]
MTPRNRAQGFDRIPHPRQQVIGHRDGITRPMMKREREDTSTGSIRGLPAPTGIRA